MKKSILISVMAGALLTSQTGLLGMQEETKEQKTFRELFRLITTGDLTKCRFK